MIWHIMILLIIIIALQLIIGHFFHKNGFSMIHSIILMLLPLGIGLYLVQIFYYERRYPKWEVPLNVKLRLKYMYLVTFLEYVAVYICLFALK
ncbi:hypothetical protein CVS44_08820 [Staphylococcus haemolyticus]|uniref:hypothetical protein n=1 Tax=Staphylococcus haemolyticus TaxID=1283 RepID=UPI000CC712F0|nr:hypothetical protein [Staphylococcus haemolyticus]MCH4336312.1 hypothetical protein [Staphylococcus haemolyticus]PNH23083.1 hypothetical protein CVS44_08820 [Staphylococcus haemolyticus]QTK07783.1 hypothetical protein J2N82_09670 [Staphylococcus haemolyticus]QTK09952.1 hypothetical protein J2N84_09690 [Staphylococcus haemolyticus]QTK12134.1 hypothetical protein J2N83_09680 [Staphylococcus haemolyticus]